MFIIAINAVKEVKTFYRFLFFAIVIAPDCLILQVVLSFYRFCFEPLRVFLFSNADYSLEALNCVFLAFLADSSVSLLAFCFVYFGIYGNSHIALYVVVSTLLCSNVYGVSPVTHILTPLLWSFLLGL